MRWAASASARIEAGLAETYHQSGLAERGPVSAGGLDAYKARLLVLLHGGGRDEVAAAFAVRPQ